jgi:hypothetical protein
VYVTVGENELSREIVGLIDRADARRHAWLEGEPQSKLSQRRVRIYKCTGIDVWKSQTTTL